VARAAFRQCVQPVADSRLGRITINYFPWALPVSAGFEAGGDPPRPFSSLGSGEAERLVQAETTMT